MSQKIREEMLPRLRQRYANRGREGRSRLLDEVCEQWGYERKHAIKLLGARAGWGGDPAKAKGRPPKYGAAVAEVLWQIWKVAEQPCGKRLAAMRAQWLAPYEATHGKLPRQVKAATLAISPAQIDRLLAPRKAKAGAKGRCGTKPGGLTITPPPTDLPTPTPRSTPTPRPTERPTPTPRDTLTPRPTATPRPTWEPSVTPTPRSTPTPRPTEQPTPTPNATPTPGPTSTPTPAHRPTTE